CREVAFRCALSGGCISVFSFRRNCYIAACFCSMVSAGFVAMAQTQTDMRIEADKSYREQATALEDRYAKLLSRLPKSAKDDLIKAQSAWTTFRDLECDFQ